MPGRAKIVMQNLDIGLVLFYFSVAITNPTVVIIDPTSMYN